MAENQYFIADKKPITFVDLFAGAGGISEGFLQSYTEDKYYEFIAASDINPNCELTHNVRYVDQLGLGMKFIQEDIMSSSFISLKIVAGFIFTSPLSSYFNNLIIFHNCCNCNKKLNIFYDMMRL